MENKNPLRRCKAGGQAGGPGLEPGMTVPETAVLPIKLTPNLNGGIVAQRRLLDKGFSGDCCHTGAPFLAVCAVSDVYGGSAVLRRNSVGPGYYISFYFFFRSIYAYFVYNGGHKISCADCGKWGKSSLAEVRLGAGNLQHRLSHYTGSRRGSVFCFA